MVTPPRPTTHNAYHKHIIFLVEVKVHLSSLKPTFLLARLGCKHVDNREGGGIDWGHSCKGCVTLSPERGCLDIKLHYYGDNFMKHCIVYTSAVESLSFLYSHSQALKMYMRARDHCTSAKHIVQLCLNIIKVRT